MRKLLCLLLGICTAASLSAQQSPELKQVIDRLDRLEAQNRELMTEIRALRAQLAAGQPALSYRSGRSPRSRSPSEWKSPSDDSPIWINPKSRASIACLLLSRECCCSTPS